MWRDKPEAYGTFPDAVFEQQTKQPAAGSAAAAAVKAGGGIGTFDAASIPNPTKTAAFLSFAFSDFVFAATGTAFFFHLQLVFGESRAPPSITDSIYPILAAVGIAGRLLSGALIDRVGPRKVQVGALCASAVGQILVPTMSGPTAYLVPVLVGLSLSCGSNVRGTVHATYFGRENLGKVQTVATSVTVLGSAVGPFPFGLAKDNLETFDVAFYASSGVTVVAAVVLYFFGHPPGGGKEGNVKRVEMVEYVKVEEDDEEVAMESWLDEDDDSD